MPDAVLKMIKRWQSDEFCFISLYEAQIRQAIIRPILRGLGWNLDDPYEVWPEYPIPKPARGDWKVDYALLTDKKLKIFIEVKEGNKQLGSYDENQLLKYACKCHVEIAILTNGATWWFYLPFYKGSWEPRKFETVGLDKQDKEEIVQKLVAFLGKENMRSGKAVQNAKDLCEKHQISPILGSIANLKVTPRLPIKNRVINEIHGAYVETHENDDFTVWVCAKQFESVQILKDTLNSLLDGIMFKSEPKEQGWLAVCFSVDE